MRELEMLPRVVRFTATHFAAMDATDAITLAACLAAHHCDSDGYSLVRNDIGLMTQELSSCVSNGWESPGSCDALRSAFAVIVSARDAMLRRRLRR